MITILDNEKKLVCVIKIKADNEKKSIVQVKDDYLEVVLQLPAGEYNARVLDIEE